MLQAFFLALGQLFDKRVAAVLIKSVLLTLTLFLGFGVALWFGLHWLADRLLGPGWGGGTMADILVIVIFFVAHWLLFRAIAIAVMDVFADDVVVAVEKKYYPKALANVRRVPFTQSTRMGIASAVRTLGLNILFIPIYFLANVASPFVFFAFNAWMLGRDLGDMVAVRHMAYRDLPAWRRRTRLRRLSLGFLSNLLFFIPGLNLVAPVVSAAMAAHSFHLGRK